MLLKTDKANIINDQLLSWFDQNKRDLVFRKDKDPYKVWISEIMAQQTQIETLLPYFKRFLKAFPDLNSLGMADEEEVLRLWEGLGYYSRAKNLLKAARELKGKDFPTSYKEILKLPGIGPYTAGAISSICFNEKVPAIDGNVIRVMSRIYNIQLDLNQSKNKSILWEELKETMSPKAGDFNEALMELGALICKPKNPSCLICPVRENCEAFNLGLIDQLPIKKTKKAKKIVENVAFILMKDDNPLYIKREEETLLNGLYGFPIFELKEQEKIKKFLQENKLIDQEEVGTSIHNFTHITWKTRVIRANILEIKPIFTTQPPSVPTAFKKMLKLNKKASEF